MAELDSLLALAERLVPDDQRNIADRSLGFRTHFDLAPVALMLLALWLVVVLTAAVIFVFMLFFADSAERAVSQAMLIGSATAVVAVTLLAIWALDNPYRPGVGSLRPAAMERTQRILDVERRLVSEEEPLPCDAEGVEVQR